MNPHVLWGRRWGELQSELSKLFHQQAGDGDGERETGTEARKGMRSDLTDLGAGVAVSQAQLRPLEQAAVQLLDVPAGATRQDATIV